MRKRAISILLIVCMVLTLLPTASAFADSSATATDATTSAHGRLADGGYNIYCLSGEYVTVDTYPSLRSVQLGFPNSTRKVFYVENKGNNQITLRVEDSYSSTGYSYVGIDASIKNGVALKLVDSPYLWNTYAENNNDLIFSLRPPADTKMLASASGGNNAPRTKLILWNKPDMDAPKHGEFRFEPVAASTKTPVASDYSFANLMQTQGAVTPVRIEGNGENSPGAVTVLYNGSTTLPKAAGSYRVTFNVAAEPPAWNAASGLEGGTLVIAPKPSTAKPVGQAINMGGITWRVLDVQDGKALVLSDLILETRAFQENTSLLNAWADSSLRTYLNGDFYDKTFTKKEKNRIVSTTLVNNINPEYSTTFGTDTKDKIFILSAEEVERYLGKDDNARMAYADRRTPAMLNTLINNISANPYEGVYQNYTTWFWWLRTPAKADDRNSLYITTNGEVNNANIDVELGVRPAMWIKVTGGGFKAYKPLSFNKQPKSFTMEDMVTAIAQDIIHEYTGDWVYNFGFPARGPAVGKTESTVGQTGAMPPGYKYWHYVFRMRCWGVLSLNDFDPLAKVTYGQFTDYLIKTMDWNLDQIGAKKGTAAYKNYKFTKETLAIAEKKAGISDTSAKAKPVKAEIKRLSKEVRYWLKAANAGNSGVRLLEGPTKTKYKVGEEFDITGLLVVTGPYGKEKNVNSKLTFTTSGVTLTPGRPFTAAGDKSINISYKGELLMTYPITVKK